MIPGRKQSLKLFLSLLLCIFFLLTALTVSVAASSSYVGNKSTKVYHTTQCTYAGKISAKNQVYFSSRTAAENSGYRRCHYCGDDVVEPGHNNSSSGSSSGSHSSATSPTSTQPPATEPQPSQTPPAGTDSWWDKIPADYKVFICSFAALIIAIGLYFLLNYFEDKKFQQPPKFAIILFYTSAVAAIPSATFLFSVVFVCGGLIACIFVGIRALVRFIAARVSDK